ncbi:MAG: PQQ-binding-like beta-propeller repeat protein [Planctomycetota bacterium]
MERKEVGDMNCSETHELLEVLLLDGLDEPQARLVRGHIAQCPACQAEKERLHLLLCEIQVSVQPSGAPGGFMEEVCRAGEAQLQAERRRAALTRRVLLGVWAAVAATVLVAVGVTRWPRETPTDPVADKLAGGAVVRWRYQGGPGHPEAAHEAIVVRGGIAYMVDGKPEQACVVAVDVATGRPKWKSKVRSAGYLEAGEGRVYCLAQAADQAWELVCLDAADGREVWRHRSRAAQGANGPGRPMAVRDGWVCWSAGPEVLLLSSRTGQVEWRRTPDPRGLPSRAVLAGDRLCVATGAGVWSVTLSGGHVAPLVMFDRRHAGSDRPMLALAGSRAYFLGSSGRESSQLFCLEVAERKLLWQRRATGVTAMTASGSGVYLQGQRVTALEGATGRTLWSVPASGAGAISVHKGLVCFVDAASGGRLMALEPQQGRTVWQIHGVRWYYGISPETHTAFVEGMDGAVRAIGMEEMGKGEVGL